VRRPLALFAAVLVAVAACGGDSDQRARSQATSTTTAPATSGGKRHCDEPGVAAHEIRFRTSDGLILSGAVVGSGPIGAVITPQLNGLGHAAQLPYASSLCGACRDVCPVKIDIPALLLHLRAQIADSAATSTSMQANDVPSHVIERLSFTLFRWTMRAPWAYRAATGAARLGQRVARALLGPRWAQRLGVIAPPLRQWTAGRELRPLASRSFRDMWMRHEVPNVTASTSETEGQTRTSTPGSRS